MRAKLLLLIALCLPGVSAAQNADKQKVEAFATAVARAEGFGVRNAIPTRNHNPGDIKSNGRYVRYKNNAEGWKALHAQITRLASGESKRYHLTMTFNQVSKIYAGDYRWGKIVAKTLGVFPTTTLAEFFADDAPPSVRMTPTPFALPVTIPVVPVLMQREDELVSFNFQY